VGLDEHVPQWSLGPGPLRHANNLGSQRLRLCGRLKDNCREFLNSRTSENTPSTTLVNKGERPGLLHPDPLLLRAWVQAPTTWTKGSTYQPETRQGKPVSDSARILRGK
jgi:hypothetical protein